MFPSKRHLFVSRMAWMKSQFHACIPQADGQIGHDFPCMLTLNICAADVLVCQGEMHPGYMGSTPCWISDHHSRESKIKIKTGSLDLIACSCPIKHFGPVLKDHDQPSLSPYESSHQVNGRYNHRTHKGCPIAFNGLFTEHI